MVDGSTASIRPTLDRLTDVHAVEHALSSDGANLFISALLIRLTDVRCTGAIGVAGNSRVPSQTLTVRAVVLRHAEGALAAEVIEADVHAVLDALLSGGEDALLIMGALLISLAEVLRRYLTLTGGVTGVARQTLTDCLVCSANAVGVQSAANVAADVGAVLQAGQHPAAGLEVGTGAVIVAAVHHRLTA